MSNVFITGCDENTKWMLPWFVKQFGTHNPQATLIVYDFGMNGIPDIPPWVEINDGVKGSQDKGWFKKPAAMLHAAKNHEYVCWIDTDIEVVSNIEGVWKYVEGKKLAMCEDLPWSTRRGERWHNSGLVAFKSTPPILNQWAAGVAANPVQGDQEVLHLMLRGDPMRKFIHICDIPRQYNVLRLDHLDNTVPDNPKAYHWTGQKGKDHIRSLL